MAELKIENPRRFSIDDDFMKSSCDDLVYGFMRSISTTRPATKEEQEEKPGVKHTEYLMQKKFQEEKKVIQTICGCTPKTIANRVAKLIECGLIEEGELVVGEHTYPCYYFPYDYNGIYKVISQEMVSYLVSTRNS